MFLRRAIFWVHLAVGVTAAVVILMLAVTGVILTYEAQLNRWALREYRADAPSPDVASLGLDELIAGVAGDRRAGLVTSVTLQRDPREPAVVRLDDGATVHVDRFTGERLGDGNTRTGRFLRSVLYWHRWFALEGEYRIVGRTFVATANLGFLFLLASGIYLWWPVTRSRAAWRHALWFRRGLGGRARDFNWHSVLGFWSAVPLAVIVVSGATISYQWAADVVHRLAGDTPPFQTSPRPWAAAGVLPVAGGDLTAVEGDAAATEGGPAATEGDPAAPGSGCRRWPRRPAPRRPDGERSRSTFPSRFTTPSRWRSTAGTAASLRSARTCCSTGPPASSSGRAGYPTFSRGFKIRRWLRFAHTGEVYGVVGQTIAGVVSLGVAVMVWTGIAMSWRRFLGSARRTRR